MAKDFKDFYETLGVNRNASEDEIKRAYRKLAQKHHPDRNKGEKDSEQKFKEINAAYEVLSDSKKRQTYDQYGQSAFTGGGGGPGGGFDFGGFGGFGEGFTDIFETFFGGGGSHARAKTGALPGDDREIGLEITFEEAAFGTEKELKITRIGKCEECKGNGAEPGTKIITCPVCSGKGEVRSVRTTILGQVTTRRVCDGCTGTGKVAEKPCSNCKGNGRVRLVEKLRTKIPAGINEGATLRISGKGDSGMRGGQDGDLYIHITIALHRMFKRKGFDVFSNQQIHLLQAVLGDNIDIQTIHGAIQMKIPAGTESVKTFRLKNYGVDKLKSSSRGDHLVTITVEIPQKLTKTERELYRKLAEEKGLKLTEEKGFFKDLI